MTFAPPDPPSTLTGSPLAFYEEVPRMLAAVEPRLSDESSATFDDKGVELGLKHLDDDDLEISAIVGDDYAIVGTGSMHEHFDADDPSWTTSAVDFIAEILRGEIEIETTYRGDAVVSVRHFNTDAAGDRQLLGSTHFLRPALFSFWKPKRTETTQQTFL